MGNCKNICPTLCKNSYFTARKVSQLLQEFDMSIIFRWSDE